MYRGLLGWLVLAAGAGALEAQSYFSGTHSGPLTALVQQCDIKGNISASGERIYHVRGQTYYDETRISHGKGERWFCSEQEAREAGWRRAKV